MRRLTLLATAIGYIFGVWYLNRHLLKDAGDTRETEAEAVGRWEDEGGANARGPATSRAHVADARARSRLGARRATKAHPE